MAGQRLRNKPNTCSTIERDSPASGSASLGACLALAVLLVSFCTASLSAFAAGTTSGSGGSSTAGATANANAAKLSFGGLARLELAMWQKVNRDRTSSSVQDETQGRAKPLQWDDRLAAVAREHSEEMAATGVFSHTGADGSRPMNRVSKAGIRWLATAENIAKIDLGSGFVPVSETTANEQVVTKAETLFMDEPRFQPNHRRNILNPAYDHVGIGIARAADGSFYITQEFAQIPN